jgi:small subunit ribosomal protein S16
MIANLMGSDGLIFLVIAVVVLLGGSQLPKIARNVGIAGKEFRKAQQEAEDEADKQRLAKERAAQEAAIPAPQPLGPAQAAQPVAPQMAAPVAQQAAPATPPAEGSITLSPAELDALLKAREEQAKREASGERG